MGMPSRQRQSATDGLYQPLADINVTPLVDVMLVLLIIFMVTAPLLAKGVKVNLPQASAAAPINQKEPIVVTVGKEGKIALGADETTPEALIDGIKVMMGDDQSRVVHIRGDTEAVYGEVVAVMDKLATNGITHIAIMTNSRSKTGPACRSRAALAAPMSVPSPWRCATVRCGGSATPSIWKCTAGWATGPTSCPSCCLRTLGNRGGTKPPGGGLLCAARALPAPAQSIQPANPRLFRQLRKREGLTADSLMQQSS